MRFFQVAVVALALLAGGVSAKKHHNKNHLTNKHVFSKIAPSHQELEDMFTTFMKQYNKKYSHHEFSSRFQVFKTNFERARVHNTEKNSTYTLGINEHSDLTFDEFKAKYFGFKPRNNEFFRNKNLHQVPEGFEAGGSVDWRSVNGVSYVTPVKNQGQCGACWAFSTTGSTEGAWAIAKQLSTPVSLSEQQLVDCATAEGNQGCNGGLMDDGFQYIITNNGICTEDSYPYTAADGTCQTCTNVVTISSFKDVTSGDENALLSAVAINPVSIAIEADQPDFQAYSGGVFSATDCGTTLDHGVLAVGYGTDSSSGQDYWIVKNSWGATWGESGYIRLVRGQNQCGLANQASYPVV